MMAVVDYISSAGAIGWPIVGLSVLLWALLGYRWSLLRLPKGYSSENPDRYQLTHEPGTLFEHLLFEARKRLDGDSESNLKLFDVMMNEFLQLSKTGSGLVGSIVAVAPLMGLLGTVGGMIVTFRSMESMALFSQGGGIAGGISQALITTQMGLAVAIPGVLMGRHLASKQACFEQTIQFYRGRLDIKALGEGDKERGV
ncbi:MAG: MotA/TolQ/ExbB proton channel family protein [Bdellovibrionales bacterium]|nr:MotA/TolQ/ExbB proton channel family protein [Bdellovibrionales bacterium]